MEFDTVTSRINGARWVPSPNFDDRDEGNQPEVLIIHCISLPPGEYGGGQVARFFQNNLPADEHPYYSSMVHLTVSSHFLIERCGTLVQFVATDKRAWHAGDSSCFERPKVNNFSIGIELEGYDQDPNGYTVPQYQTLAELTLCLRKAYPSIKRNSVFSHSDIAPGRKPDPGPYFDWRYYYFILDNLSI